MQYVNNSIKNDKCSFLQFVSYARCNRPAPIHGVFLFSGKPYNFLQIYFSSSRLTRNSPLVFFLVYKRVRSKNSQAAQIRVPSLHVIAIQQTS